jgi:hypothetical protein
MDGNQINHTGAFPEEIIQTIESGVGGDQRSAVRLGSGSAVHCTSGVNC